MNTYKRRRFQLGAPHPTLFPMLFGSTIASTSATAGMPDHSIEDLLAERGITVSREAIRLWWIKFGALYTRRLKQKNPEASEIPSSLMKSS